MLRLYVSMYTLRTHVTTVPSALANRPRKTGNDKYSSSNIARPGGIPIHTASQPQDIKSVPVAQNDIYIPSLETLVLGQAASNPTLSPVITTRTLICLAPMYRPISILPSRLSVQSFSSIRTQMRRLVSSHPCLVRRRRLLLSFGGSFCAICIFAIPIAGNLCLCFLTATVPAWGRPRGRGCVLDR